MNAESQLRNTDPESLPESHVFGPHYFRSAMAEPGFNIASGTHPIVLIVLGNATLAARFAEAMLVCGLYAISFSKSFPEANEKAQKIRAFDGI